MLLRTWRGLPDRTQQALAGQHASCPGLPEGSTDHPPLPPCSPICLLQVSKKLLLLYVQEEGGSSGSGSGSDHSSPNSLSKVAVHERLVRRWVPESHRPPHPAGGK